MSLVNPDRNKRGRFSFQLICPRCRSPLTYAKDGSNNIIIYICTKIGCGYRKPLPLNEHILDIRRRCGSWDSTVYQYERGRL